jgi:drug/metabolite transporter (DMT)-like permease
LASVVLVWAGAFAAIKYLLDTALTGPEIALARYLISVPGFVLAFRFAGGLPGITRGGLARIAVGGIFGTTVYHIALNEGEQFTTSGTAAVIIGTSPAVTLGMAVALGLERFSAWRALGLVLAFSGVVVVVTLGSGENVSFADAKGPLIILVASIAFAVYNVVLKPVTTLADPIAISSAAGLFGTAALLPFLRVDSLDHFTAVGLWEWTLIAYLGLVCTLFAYIAWTIGLRSLDASRASSYLYGIPPLAVLIGAATLGETVTLWLVLGTLMVIGGVAMAQVRR